MSILNFGSLNIDHVYRVDHFVQPGETINSLGYQQFAGGKGYNQSTALAKAGARVFHAGRIGRDGAWLKERLEEAGADVSFTEVIDSPSGHAVIQVDGAGENCIVLHGGANREVDPAFIEKVLEPFGSGDYLLLQNEISHLPDIISRASGKGLKIAFNPAPMGPEVRDYPLDRIDLFILNEIEARELTGESEPAGILEAMRVRYPKAAVVLTRGSKGALYGDGHRQFSVAAERVTPVDTTAAGDTFTGYFLSHLILSGDPEAALRLGCRASAICVTRMGAAESIPALEEIS